MAARVPEESIVRDLERLATAEDDALAREAFDRLWSMVRPPLERWLRRRGAGGDDGEDALQRAAAQLWRNRGGILASSPGEWYALSRRATRRCLAEAIVSQTRIREVESDVSVEDAPLLDALVSLALDAERAYDAADRLWLGEAPSRGTAVPSAAAQQVLLEGASEEEAAQMFGVGPERVRAWLADPAVVARALFASLCWPGEALAGYLLRPESPVAPDELDAAALGSPGRWSAPEARAVVLRARNGLREEEILRQVQGGLDAEAVGFLIARYREALPFPDAARTLLARLCGRGIEAALASPGLWRRIAFEYAGQELHREQIEERADPAARVAGARVDVATLRNWLSAGRLYAQLAARLVEEAVVEAA